MKRWVTLFLVMLFAGQLSGCSNTNMPEGFLENDDPAPIFHIFPSWISENEIVFESIGAVGFGPGWAAVDPDRAGIISLNIDTDVPQLLVSGGVFPRASVGLERFVCFQGVHNGVIVVGDLRTQYRVEEPMNWGTRSDVEFDRTGKRLIWRSVFSDQKTGLWEYNLETQEYNFIAAGYHPTWSPVEDKIIFIQRELIDEANPYMVSYDFFSDTFDTLRTFNIGESAGDMCFSPDGTRLAYFHLSLDSTELGIYIFSIEDRISYQITQGRGYGLSWGSRGIVYSNSCIDVADSRCGVLWLVDVETGLKEQLTTRLQFADIEVPGGVVFR